MEKLIKQPNGKYCALDYRGELKFFNYTEQNIIDMYIENANSDMEGAEHFGEIIKKIEYGDVCRVKRTVDDKCLELMGFNQSYNELVKFVPRRPTNQQYASCDFATYGKCPNCGGSVQNGMGGKDDKCRNCGQLLKW